MAEGCCLQIVSYFMAVQNLLAGSILLTTLQYPQGAVCIALGCLLFVAVYRRHALCLLVYVIVQGLLLSVVSIWCIVKLFKVDLDHEKYSTYIFYIAAFIPTFLLLVLVFLHYREVSQEKKEPIAPSRNTSTFVLEEKSYTENDF